MWVRYLPVQTPSASHAFGSNLQFTGLLAVGGNRRLVPGCAVYAGSGLRLALPPPLFSRTSPSLGCLVLDARHDRWDADSVSVQARTEEALLGKWSELQRGLSATAVVIHTWRGNGRGVV